MCQLNTNDDGTYSFNKLFNFADGDRLITINGNKEDNILNVIISITPPLKGKMAYKCNRIPLKQMIEDGKVRITDKDIFCEYSLEVVNGIECLLNEFLNKLMDDNI